MVQILIEVVFPDRWSLFAGHVQWSQHRRKTKKAGRSLELILHNDCDNIQKRKVLDFFFFFAWALLMAHHWSPAEQAPRKNDGCGVSRESIHWGEFSQNPSCLSYKAGDCYPQCIFILFLPLGSATKLKGEGGFGSKWSLCTAVTWLKCPRCTVAKDHFFFVFAVTI